MQQLAIAIPATRYRHGTLSKGLAGIKVIDFDLMCRVRSGLRFNLSVPIIVVPAFLLRVNVENKKTSARAEVFLINPICLFTASGNF